MAGVSTAAMAAAVSETGALGSIAVGNLTAEAADAQLVHLRRLTSRPVNVNVFTHRSAVVDVQIEERWLRVLQPFFAEFDAEPPTYLRSPYPTFDENDALFDVLLAHRPSIVSFHFGVPAAHRIAALRKYGAVLLGTVTTLTEARAMAASGVDVIVAQGVEAGGHRGTFDGSDDAQHTTRQLVDLLLASVDQPIIAAGGVIYGQEINALLDRPVQAVQLGTAFIGATESAASPAFRKALARPGLETVITPVISGRPARGIVNRFAQALAEESDQVPPYPIAYAAGKALHEAALRKGSVEFAAMWASRAVPIERHRPAADIVDLLLSEMG